MKKIIKVFLLLVFGFGLYYFYPESRLPKGVKIDKIKLNKKERLLIVYANGKEIKKYTIALGRNPKGKKEIEGDKKTPEGQYFINDKNAYSGYHKNLGISYPNKQDIEKAKLLGCTPGGDIKIHGLKNGMGFIGKFHRWFDWTNGCIALTDDEVDELFIAVSIGTPIEINP